ncbi:MAG: DNA polymerase III subunit delta [Bacillota bacterium]|nr:DNA polymerase III subunit delta [Bacillota bacterium]
MIPYQVAVRRILDKKYSPLYLLWGEERYLQQELVNSLADSFLGQDNAYGKEVIEGAGCKLEDLLTRANETGIFASRNLLVIDNPPFLVSSGRKDESTASEKEADPSEEPSWDLLNNFVEQFKAGSQDSIVVFLAVKPDKRRRLYKYIDTNGLAVECEPLKGEALTSWINNKVQLIGKQIERPALERLLLAGNQNLYNISNELEKYCTYLDEEEQVITAEIVDFLHSGDIQGDVFKLSDAVTEGEFNKAYHLLELLYRKREKPLLIFFMLVRHYRLMLQAKSLLEEGIPASEFPKALEVHPFVARKLREQAARYEQKTLEKILIELQQFDLKIKTGLLDPEQALYLLIGYLDLVQSK